MRFYYISAVVAVTWLVGICSSQQPVQGCDYYGSVVYYPAAPVVYYGYYTPVYLCYAPRVYYVRPDTSEPSSASQRSTDQSYSKAQPPPQSRQQS
jgi:hypothetical protein